MHMTTRTSMMIRSALMVLFGGSPLVAAAGPGNFVQDPQRLAQALLVREAPAPSGIRIITSTSRLDPQQQAIRLLTGNANRAAGSTATASAGLGARNFDSHEAARRLLGRGV
jgi:hypothetical protein